MASVEYRFAFLHMHFQAIYTPFLPTQTSWESCTAFAHHLAFFIVDKLYGVCGVWHVIPPQEPVSHQLRGLSSKRNLVDFWSGLPLSPTGSRILSLQGPCTCCPHSPDNILHMLFPTSLSGSGFPVLQSALGGLGQLSYVLWEVHRASVHKNPGNLKW